MRSLAEVDVDVPARVKTVGFAAAIQAMVQRIANPDMPARDILVDFRLVVRDSSGACNNPVRS